MAESGTCNEFALLERLKDYLGSLDRLLISYSGGVDSSFLAVVAQECLPGRVVCVLLDSPLVPRKAIEAARERAEYAGIPLEVIPFPLLEEGRFRANQRDRCYVCKKEAAAILHNRARTHGIGTIADGVNRTDLREFRPGIRAMDEAGVTHPLAACGFEKGDIRAVSQLLGLPFSRQESSPCLATRIPYGTDITREKLGAIEHAEEFLRSLGIEVLRVRLHGDCARIEVRPGDKEKVLSSGDEIYAKFRQIGIPYASLDLLGYRSGSMDEQGNGPL